MRIDKITSENELTTAFNIRKAVFVEEQGVPHADEYDEFDKLSAPCEHVLVYHNDTPVGTGRIRWVDEFGKLERISILENYRSLGLGKAIICALEEIAKENGIKRVKLHGQTHAEGFYQKLGYETGSPVFMEDGIPHVLMMKVFA
ncbi:GNAT family N-acetyltransferase [Sporosarcina pasteurii]|uniref:Putative acyltransferase n=1 Tax=Sporosarcina pasteurii TaxID=1474 RepID=A0A380CJU1_SPOPA|nr:GNAT family N-acetyltransferase [Sporosarcina pasteurii]MDS9471875.1 GNAT family N-acetyltransferase [Sporosarcina pasteurii]QBQ06612.1 GNAT family N-acetyltransferase [Sporosarcina pasteurii]SUJ21989.1 putative acyltransferase [Sporosarcina pasteurii]